jgi:ABC-type lipoprotein release transport system permease subunit
MRSLVILLSVAIGLFAGIAVLSLYNGMMDSRIRTVIEEETSHLQIHHPQFPSDNEMIFTVSNSTSLEQELRKRPDIKEICQRSIVHGMLSTTTGSAGVQITGILPEKEYAVSGLKSKLKDNGGFHLGKKSEILIGQKLADKLKLHKGSKLVLTMTDTANNLVAGAFRIAGIYQSTNAPLDERIVYVQKEELNTLIQLPAQTHEIAILLKKDTDVERIQQEIQIIYPQLLTETWKELSPETNLLIKTVDQYSLIILLIVFMALAFGIINTMLMAILERTREIGMMMALGTSRIRLFGMVMSETLFLTIAGTPIGLLFSWFTIQHYHLHGLDFSSMGKDLMSSFGFKTVIYPVFPADKLFMVFIVVSGTALISGLLPAYRALRMNPSDALRY